MKKWLANAMPFTAFTITVLLLGTLTQCAGYFAFDEATLNRASNELNTALIENHKGLSQGKEPPRPATVDFENTSMGLVLAISGGWQDSQDEVWCTETKPQIHLTRKRSLWNVGSDDAPTLNHLLTLGVSAEADAELVARSLELCLFNTRDKYASNRARLCQGTSLKLQERECLIVEQAMKPVSGSALGELFAEIRSAQLLSLLTGTLQYLTVAYAVMKALQLFLRRRTLMTDVTWQQWKQGMHVEEGRALAFEDTVPIGIRAIYRGLNSELRSLQSRADPRTPSDTTPEALHRSAGRYEYASFCEQSELAPFRAATDVVVKLAFLGTLWGIALALFAAANLNAADILKRAQASFVMYTSLATAFGTTLVGIVVSLILGKYLDRVQSNGEQQIRFAVREAELAIADGSEPLLHVPDRPTPDRRFGRHLREGSWAVPFFVIALIGTALWLANS